jgi:hypothetical protein
MTPCSSRTIGGVDDLAQIAAFSLDISSMHWQNILLMPLAKMHTAYI